MMLTGGGTFAWAEEVGSGDNSTGWWGATSQNYRLKGHGTYNFKFTTTNDATTTAWHTWTMVVKKGTDAYKEYFRLRGDNYAYTTAESACGAEYNSNSNSDKISVSTTYDGSDLKASMNGATVVMNVAYNENGTITAIAYVTPLDGNIFTMTCNYLVGDADSDDLDIFFTIENAYVNITSVGQQAEITYDFSTMSNLSITRSGRAWKPNGSFEFLTITNSDLLKYFFAFTTAGAPEVKNGNLTNTSGNAAYMAIINLKAGDRVTFFYTTGSNGGLSFRNHSSAISFTTDNVGITSGKTYTAISDGNLGVQISKTTTYVSKVIIATSAEETVTAPTISAAADGANRTISIATTVSNLSSPVTAYYTIDGTTPTASSTKYTAPFSIQETKTIKAITISNSSLATESEVTTQEIEAGVAIQLVKPTITRTSPTSVTIASNQTGLFGEPNATIHYSYGSDNGTIEGVNVSKELTITEDANITAYATATGYTASEEASLAVAPYPAIELDNVSRITSYTEGALDTSEGKGQVGTKCTYYPFVIDGSQWSNNFYFQPYDNSKGGFGFRSGKTWYNNSSGANYGWMLVKNMHKGDVIIVNIDQAASNLVNATYAGKYSYGTCHGYTVNADGNVELRFARIGSGSSAQNNTFYGVMAYTGKVFGTIAQSGYSSLASAYGLDFANATGLTDAFVVTKTTTDAVNLTSVDELPANCGVILKGEAGATYSIPVKADAVYTGTNLLSAAVNPTVVENDAAYILKGGQFVLISGAVTEAARTIPAGKAYLLKSNVPSNARTLNFAYNDDETTDISSIAGGIQDGEIFNLQGQRVNTPAKGLYIVNGKKVVINK